MPPVATIAFSLVCPADIGAGDQDMWCHGVASDRVCFSQYMLSYVRKSTECEEMVIRVAE